MKKTTATFGAALGGLPLVFGILGILAACPACFAWDVDAGTPAPSEGDIVFYVDVVTFYDGPDRNLEEIYCVVPNEQIKFVESGGLLRGRLKYSVSVTDSAGRLIESTDKNVDVGAATSEHASSRNVVQVLQSKVIVPPGKYSVRVALEDPNARKKTILSYFLRRYKTGVADLFVDSKRFGEGGLAISDIEFARSVRRTSDGSFEKSGYEIIPNAQRQFGRLLPEMAVFFEVYDLRAAAQPDSLTATYSILTKEGNAVFSNRMPLAVRGPKFAATALFDLSSLAGGGYALDLTLEDRSGAVLASSSRRFDVVWSLLSWGKYENEKIGDLAFVLTESEMREFRQLSPGEQEKFLISFWKKIDPTPATVDNEALDEHYRRVDYADEHYGTATVRGALTDRGRIYIKYGPPDDIQSFYSDYEFIRDKRDMEGASNPVPTDPFARVGIKTGTTGGEAGGSGADEYSDQRGGTTVHGKPYETWSYDGPGDPVRRLSERISSSAAMSFMFVDERGVGDFRMIYSSEKQEY
ncbi:MAG: GWxTD domain-containing protein [bacterium]